MPLLKPTTKLGVYGKFDIKPADAVGNYIESKQQNRKYLESIQKGEHHIPLEILLVHNERDRKLMTNDQLQMISDSNEYKVTRAKRIEILTDTQTKLREEFAKVNSYMTVCEEKGRRAERQVAVEIRNQKELKKSIETYTNEIQDLEDFNKELQRSVELLEPYELVMKQVVADNDLYKNIEDCMKRCDAITLAEGDIKELERKNIQEVEEMRCKVVREVKDTESVLVGIKNEWDDFEQKYNEAKVNNLKAEKKANNAKEWYTSNEMQHCSMMNAIEHMYTILCRRRGLEVALHKVSVEEMLDFIRTEIGILEKVVEICLKKRDERNKAMQNRMSTRDSIKQPFKLKEPVLNNL